MCTRGMQNLTASLAAKALIRIAIVALATNVAWAQPNSTRAVAQDGRNFGQPIPLQPTEQVVDERVVNLGPYGTKFVQVIRQAPQNPTAVIQLANGAVVSFKNGTDAEGNQLTHQVVEVQQGDGSTHLQVSTTLTTPSGQVHQISKTFGAGASVIGGSGRSDKSDRDRDGPFLQPPGAAVFSPEAMPLPPIQEGALLAALGVPDVPAPQTWDLPSHLLVFLVPGAGPSAVYMQYGILGDMNCDGAVSVADIGPFVLALTDPDSYFPQFPGCDLLAADMNSDGQVSVGDIGTFVARLTGA